ncbi:MAG: hypothetical protein BroJett040_22620 [Oligoflexia bacterium]|nr:MAG: hypothetical protein BroJett040_22620 [Oligoflexia bacterium]
MKNEKGTGAVVLLLILPIFMGTIYAIGTQSLEIQKITRGRHLCRSHLLETQKKVGLLLAKIIQMNPVVSSLRTEKAMAEAALKIAIETGDYPAMGAAQVWLKSIEARQVMIARQQRLLFTLVKGQFNLGLRLTQSAIRSELEQIQARSQKSWAQNISPIKIQIPQPPLSPDIPDNSDTEPRIYTPKEPFIEKAAVHASWITSLETTDRIKEWFSIKTKNSDGCSVSLEEKAGGFQPVLIKGKF